MPSGIFIELIQMSAGSDPVAGDQLARLQARLEGMGKRVTATREPGVSAYAEAIGRFQGADAGPPLPALAQALLYGAARIECLDEKIGPALRDGVSVLSHRSVESTQTFQRVSGGFAMPLGNALERVVSNGLKPDLTILFDRQPGVSGERTEETAFEGRGEVTAPDSFQSHLREALLVIAKREPAGYAVISADGPPEAVEEAVWKEVSVRFATLATHTQRAPDAA